MVAHSRSARAESIRELTLATGAAIKAKRKFTTGIEVIHETRDAVAMAAFAGVILDDWQVDALSHKAHDLLLLVPRQAGKGEVATWAALEGALNNDDFTVVIVARAGRQAKRLLKRILRRYNQLPSAVALVAQSAERLAFANGSEILAVPGSEETIRGIDAVDLLIIDEASLVKDDLFASVYPMLATTDGMCLAMTTPRGKRGWFYDNWIGADVDWYRVTVDWRKIARYSESFIARQRRRFGEYWFRQEFGCEFLDSDSQFFATELVDAAMVSGIEMFDLPTLDDIA